MIVNKIITELRKEGALYLPEVEKCTPCQGTRTVAPEALHVVVGNDRAEEGDHLFFVTQQRRGRRLLPLRRPPWSLNRKVIDTLVECWRNLQGLF